MEGQQGISELSVISWVSAVEGCPLSGVPLYVIIVRRYNRHWYVTCWMFYSQWIQN